MSSEFKDKYFKQSMSSEFNDKYFKQSMSSEFKDKYFKQIRTFSFRIDISSVQGYLFNFQKYLKKNRF